MTLLEDWYSRMSKFSLVEKRILKLMIVDCDIHNMTEKESLSYIRTQFGKSISRRTFYNYKNLVYQGSNRRIRFIPKWIRGIHLMGLQRDMGQAPLGVV
jgi:hypothetical protein